jgi:hypothetical protein
MTDFDRFPVAFPKRTIGPNDEEKVSPARVFGILKGRGYGFGAHSGYALVLQRKSGTVRKTDGMPTYVPFGMGISKKDLANIIATSQTAQVAADRIEAIARGESSDSFQGDAVTRRASGISLEDVDKRVQEGILKVLAGMGLKPPEVVLSVPPPVSVAVAAQPVGFRPLLAEDAIMAESSAVTAVPGAREKKKRGWPKGKPRGPRKPKVEAKSAE